MRQAVNFAIIAAIAAAVAFLPGGGDTASVIGVVLGIAFGLAIGFFGYRLYREQRFTLDSLEPVERFVLYACIGLAFLAFTGYYGTLAGTSGGVLVLILLIGVASFGVFWVFTHSRRYD
jgi:hypothetical protein